MRMSHAVFHRRRDMASDEIEVEAAEMAAQIVQQHQEDNDRHHIMAGIIT